MASERFSLSRLSEGMPGITPAFGRVLCEAAAVCLQRHHRPPAVMFLVEGSVSTNASLEWTAATAESLRCYADFQFATELGAYGVAIVIAWELFGQVVVERSRKGTGVDYWLGSDDGMLFQEKTALEVSGMLRGDDAAILARVRKKVEQALMAGNRRAYVIVVEFGTPKANVVVRHD